MATVAEFPDSLVDLVARALASRSCYDVFDDAARAGAPWEASRAGYREEARAVLTALAEAGHLMPEAVSTQVWVGIRVRSGEIGSVCVAGAGDEPLRRAAARGDGVLVRQTLRHFADGSRLYGPWLPVDTTPTSGGTNA